MANANSCRKAIHRAQRALDLLMTEDDDPLRFVPHIGVEGGQFLGAYADGACHVPQRLPLGTYSMRTGW